MGGSIDRMVRTVVVVGRTGNGKSATANSILGYKAFKSKASSTAVTDACKLQTTVLGDGQIVNVIDTPGLFDVTAGSESIGREIVKCINIAKDGIHALLLVFSVTNRFSEEEGAVFRSLQAIFGSRIVDYMIVVFTGGDELEANEETLEDYLARGCPKHLKEILGLCKNRLVLFDNKTKDESKRADQVEELLDLVDMVMAYNDGQPYTDELFAELKKSEIELHNREEHLDSQKGLYNREITEFKDRIERSYEEQLKRMAKMFDSKFKEISTTWLEQQLAEEQAARPKAEKQAKLNQKKSNDEICMLREHLERAGEDSDESMHLQEPVRATGPPPNSMYADVEALSNAELKDVLTKTDQLLEEARGQYARMLEQVEAAWYKGFRRGQRLGRLESKLKRLTADLKVARTRATFVNQKMNRAERDLNVSYARELWDSSSAETTSSEGDLASSISG